MARWLIFPLFISEIKSIIRLFKDKNASKKHKAVIIFGLVYLLSPIDLIPAPILGLSIVDDLVIWAAILYYLKEPLSQYKDEPASKSSKATGRKKYKGKNVMDVEDYVIVDEDEEKSGDDQ